MSLSIRNLKYYVIDPALECSNINSAKGKCLDRILVRSNYNIISSNSFKQITI